MIAIVAYGSLIDVAQFGEHSVADAEPVVVDGYRRAFNQEPSWRKGHGIHRAALNVVPGAGARFNGVLVHLRADSDLQALDERERGYDRVRLDASRLTGLLETDVSVRCETIYLYTGKPEKRNDGLLPNSDYLELCLRGAELWGADFYRSFLQTTYIGEATLKACLNKTGRILIKRGRIHCCLT